MFIILADFNDFGINAQVFHSTNFGFSSNIVSFSILFIHSEVV
jgi:hypothetical protein